MRHGQRLCQAVCSSVGMHGSHGGNSSESVLSVYCSGCVAIALTADLSERLQAELARTGGIGNSGEARWEYFRHVVAVPSIKQTGGVLR